MLRIDGEEASDIARHALVTYKGAVLDVILEKVHLGAHADQREADHDRIIATVLDDVRYLPAFEKIDEGEQVLQAAEGLHFTSLSSLAVFVSTQQLEAFPSIGISGFAAAITSEIDDPLNCPGISPRIDPIQYFDAKP